MTVELWLRVVAGATPTRFTLTTMVGKPKSASGARDSVFGYKRPFGASRIASALRPASDIRALNLRS